MEKHPIGELMETTMSKIREMIDVNTIVGTPVKTDDGITLIPVSKVSFGFASGGSDFQSKNQQPGNPSNFGGGSGAGVSISPVAFLVVKDGSVKMISAQPSPQSSAEKIVEAVPEIIDKVKEFIPNKKDVEN